ncbi:MAG TPA: agmatinase [Alphaproteobacteria bacterium]|nr:agmatinase [Rhodospirillaceae bacterium]HRJ66573.1 agmatinase [Alphaproteobacteria bacterium]
MQFLSSAKGFLGLQKKDAASPKDAKAVIIPFGLESSVSYGGGTAKGPQAMIDASHQVELFDDEFWCEPFRRYGVVTMNPPRIAKGQVKALAQLEGMVEDTLKAGKFPFVFGGEHALTAGSIRPFAKRYKDLVVLQIDAHADLRDGYDGEHYSHAAAMRRVLDNPNVKLVSFGIRNISQEEIPFLEKNGKRVKIYWAREKAQWDMKEIVKHFKGKPVYVTFDIDGFDSSLIPATGTPEPGGLFWDEAMTILREVAKVGHIVGADVNELAPKPNMHGCDFLAAKLAYKILSFAFLISHRNKLKKSA